jgi:hypothetical protein
LTRFNTIKNPQAIGLSGFFIVQRVATVVATRDSLDSVRGWLRHPR